MVLTITNSRVAVAGHFPVALGDGGSNRVGVEVAASLSVDEADSVTISGETQLAFGVIGGVAAVGIEEPVVVGVLVVVAGNLLLRRALGISLVMRMEQATAVAHILQGGAGAVRDLQRAVLTNIGTTEVGLEERAHLSIAGAAVLKNEEMEEEGEDVDSEGNGDKAKDAEAQVSGEFGLCLLVIAYIAQR